MSNGKPATVRPNALIWLVLSAAIILLDQWTKLWVLTTLPEYRPVVVIEGFWNWFRTYNKGAAFSFLSNAGGWQLWFFSLLAVAISGLLTYWLARTPRREWNVAMPFALVIGGAIGNVIDRLRFGHVVDFIQWHYRGFYWPAFNIADTSIVMGAILIAVGSLFADRNKNQR
ncbi:signal peptidase II [Aquilutibacter rugosus]|uniref:signal peptidase II n=1 Tax=Aquilutibacter rugosus TaxID=3115820 RepID=UPI002F3E36DA